MSAKVETVIQYLVWCPDCPWGDDECETEEEAERLAAFHNSEYHRHD